MGVCYSYKLSFFICRIGEPQIQCGWGSNDVYRPLHICLLPDDGAQTIVYKLDDLMM